MWRFCRGASILCNHRSRDSTLTSSSGRLLCPEQRPLIGRCFHFVKLAALCFRFDLQDSWRQRKLTSLKLCFLTRAAPTCADGAEPGRQVCFLSSRFARPWQKYSVSGLNSTVRGQWGRTGLGQDGPEQRRRRGLTLGPTIPCTRECQEPDPARYQVSTPCLPRPGKNG